MTNKYINFQNEDAYESTKIIIDYLYDYYTVIHHLYEQKDIMFKDMYKNILKPETLSYYIKELKSLNVTILKILNGAEEVFSEDKVGVTPSSDRRIRENYNIVRGYVNFFIIKKEIEYLSKVKDCENVVTLLNECTLLYRDYIEKYFENWLFIINSYKNGRSEINQEIEEKMNDSLILYNRKLKQLEDIKNENIFSELKISVGSNMEIDNIFESLEEHINYLEENNYKIKKSKEVTALKTLNNTVKMCSEIKSKKKMFHGTSIEAAKLIIKDGKFKGITSMDCKEFDYNKIFFSNRIKTSNYYGLIGGTTLKYPGRDIYIIFKCDLSNYEVYSLMSNSEFFVWGEVSTEAIKKIYLCEKKKILKEITKEELLVL